MSASTSIQPSQYVVSYLRQQLPIEVYNTAKKENKELIHHFLIVSKQPSSSILSWLEVCNQKYHAFINQKDTAQHIDHLTNGESRTSPATGMTPFALAILMARRDVVEALSQSLHLNPEIGDRRGWIPLQHAIVVGDPDLLALVEATTDRVYGSQGETEEKAESKSTSDKVRVAAKERFAFLRSIIGRPTIQDTDPAVRYQIKPGHSIFWSQADFKKETGTQFYDGIWGTRDALFANWQRPSLYEGTFMRWMREKWSAYDRKKPPLLLTRFPGAGLGVISQRKVPLGSIICTFGSELNPPDSYDQDRKSPYSNTHSTGVRIRNWGSMINDGFPNVLELGINLDGVEVCSIMTISPIEPQTQLLLDSGIMNPIKWGARCEMNLDDIYAFFPTKNSLLDHWNRIRKELDYPLEQTPEFLLDLRSRKAKLGYLFSTPSLCLSMVVQGRLVFGDIDFLLKNQTFLETVNISGELTGHVIQFYMKALNLIRNFEERAPKNVNKVLRDFLAIRILSNVRAGMIAFERTLESCPMTADLLDRFDEIYKGGEALFFLLEECGDQQVASKIFEALNPEDQQALIRLSKGRTIHLFGNRDRIQKVYTELEKELS